MTRIEGDARRAPRYVPQWRPDLTCLWLRLDPGEDDLAGVVSAASIARERHGGQVRVVEQRVVYVDGLGADYEGGVDE